jgi:hypothetical protein
MCCNAMAISLSDIALHNFPTHLNMTFTYSVIVEVVKPLQAGVCIRKPASANIHPWYCRIFVSDWGPFAPCSPLLANPRYTSESGYYWIAELLNVGLSWLKCCSDMLFTWCHSRCSGVWSLFILLTRCFARWLSTCFTNGMDVINIVM